MRRLWLSAKYSNVRTVPDEFGSRARSSKRSIAAHSNSIWSTGSPAGRAALNGLSASPSAANYDKLYNNRHIVELLFILALTLHLPRTSERASNADLPSTQPEASRRSGIRLDREFPHQRVAELGIHDGLDAHLLNPVEPRLA